MRRRTVGSATLATRRCSSAIASSSWRGARASPAAASTRQPAMRAAAEQDMAGVDADPHLEAFLAVGARDPLGLQPRLGEEVEAGEHGALGVVFARGLGAEGSEQAVAGVLQYLAAALGDPGAERLQRRIHDVEQVLGIDGLAESGGADDVEEQH